MMDHPSTRYPYGLESEIEIIIIIIPCSSGAVVGESDHGTRDHPGGGYWELLKKARIVVTGNPTKWEGDYR
jgi:hypothetical protein